MRNTNMASSEVREQRDGPFILDVRPAYAYEESHIQGSHNVPVYDQVQGGNFIGLDASLDALPEEETIAVVCYSGSTAAGVAAYLRERGYDARRLVGGMNAWEGPTDGTISSATRV